MTTQYENTSLSEIRKTSLLARATQLAITAFLLLIAVIAGTVILFLFRSKPDPVLPDESVMTFTAFQGYVAPAEEQLTITERPLFWQERRPIAAEQNIEAPEPVIEQNRNIDDFELIGLFKAGTNSSAIVMYKKEKHRLRLNEELAGWRLVDISDNAAAFEESSASAEEKIEMLMLYDPISLPQLWLDNESQLNNPSDF